MRSERTPGGQSMREPIRRPVMAAGASRSRPPDADDSSAPAPAALASILWLPHDARMIDRFEMMQPLLQACPSFQPEWEAFLGDWADESEKPIYLALGQLARHLASMLAANDVSGLTRVFDVIERWHVEGDAFV